jgi:hypothetical protein
VTAADLVTGDRASASAKQGSADAAVSDGVADQTAADGADHRTGVGVRAA